MFWGGIFSFIEDFNRKKCKGGKLDFHWQGPFMVISSLSKGLFKLKKLHGTKVNIY